MLAHTTTGGHEKARTAWRDPGFSVVHGAVVRGAVVRGG
jgi:hypothetical protein